VRHILILISFLLLSSFVTSCDKKEETLYRWETSSGIVWKRFGDKDTHRVYKGEWKNEKLNGLGVMTYPDGGKYVGRWKDDKRNGQGTYTFPDGGKYVGEWKDGIPWNGTDYDKYGNIIGKFVNGKEIKQ